MLGIAGIGFVPLRWIITFVTPVYATAVFVVVITRSDSADAGTFGVAGMVAATIAGFGPVWSWLRGMRSPSVLAAAVLVALLYLLVLELLPWMPVGAGALAAAIAGPPPRRRGQRRSVAADDDRLDALQ